MSGLDLLTERDLTTKRKPASQWRNKWRLRGVRVRLATIDTVWSPGIHWGPDAFPTKEIAEQRALDKIREGQLVFADGSHTVAFRRYFEWLGAFAIDGGDA